MAAPSPGLTSARPLAPVDAKPLFRPDVLRSHLEAFALPERMTAARPKLEKWAELLRSGRADGHKETRLPPGILSDVFCDLLGYAEPAAAADYTLTREQLGQADGKFADAVLGRFGPGGRRSVVAVEGKGLKDPLDRPFAGRKMSAVDQAYRYAINLPCDWVVVTSVRQTRHYSKGTDRQTYERFDTEALAADERQLRRFAFLLGAERVVPAEGDCHLDAPRAASE